MTKKTKLTVEEALAIIDDESTEWTLVESRTEAEARAAAASDDV